MKEWKETGKECNCKANLKNWDGQNRQMRDEKKDEEQKTIKTQIREKGQNEKSH